MTLRRDTDHQNVMIAIEDNMPTSVLCPICKTDITDPIKQFGNIPLCQSCYLSGDSWIGDDPDVMSLLLEGMSLDDAMKKINKDWCKTMNDEFNEFFRDVNIVRVVTR